MCSLIVHRSWKIQSARSGLLQKTKSSCGASISVHDLLGAQRPLWRPRGPSRPGRMMRISASATRARRARRHRFGVRMRGQPALIGFGIGDGGGRGRRGADPREALQPRHGQAEQVAALAVREGVDLVDDDRAEPGEKDRAVLRDVSSSAQRSGVVRSICGGRTRWRARRSEGVSPLRVSTRIARPISSIGASRLRWTSTASAFSGET